MRRRARIIEAAFWLVAARVLVARIALPRWSFLLGAPRPVAIRADDLAERRGPVAGAVLSAARHLPYEPTCLEEAAAAQVMLRLRRRSGTVVIGLDRADPTRDPHAWLLNQDGHIVLGGENATGFVPVTAFAHR